MFDLWGFCFSQLMEVTGKNQDECMVALHDCNEDVSRAINFLLESTSDMVKDYYLKPIFHFLLSVIVNTCLSHERKREHHLH